MKNYTKVKTWNGEDSKKFMEDCEKENIDIISFDLITNKNTKKPDMEECRNLNNLNGKYITQFIASGENINATLKNYVLNSLEYLIIDLKTCNMPADVMMRGKNEIAKTGFMIDVSDSLSLLDPIIKYVDIIYLTNNKKTSKKEFENVLHKLAEIREEEQNNFLVEVNKTSLAIEKIKAMEKGEELDFDIVIY